MLIARYPSCCTTEVLDGIDRLAHDPVPAVRFQIARYLTCLYQTAPERMWHFLSQRVRGQGQVVLGAFADAASGLLVCIRTPRLKLRREFRRAVGNQRAAEDARRNCLNTLVRLHIWHDHVFSHQFNYGLVHSFRTNLDDFGTILFDIRGALSHGEAEVANQKDKGIRKRAIDLFGAITTAACKEFGAAFSEAEKPGRTQADVDSLKKIARLVDQCAHELYFASGVFDHQQGKSSISARQQQRFYEETGPIIDRLTSIGLPSVVHYLVETLQACVLFDPKRVFLQIMALVRSGKPWNYQYESLAIDIIVRIVNRYLAEYRTLLKKMPNAGWPCGVS